MSDMKRCPACRHNKPEFDRDAFQCPECGLRAPFAQTIPAGFSAKMIAAGNWNALPRDDEAEAFWQGAELMRQAFKEENEQ